MENVTIPFYYLLDNSTCYSILDHIEDVDIFLSTPNLTKIIYLAGLFLVLKYLLDYSEFLAKALKIKANDRFYDTAYWFARAGMEVSVFMIVLGVAYLKWFA